LNVEVRRYDRLFLAVHPDAGGKDFLETLNRNSLKVNTVIGAVTGKCTARSKLPAGMNPDSTSERKHPKVEEIAERYRATKFTAAPHLI
jgi:hypothetical protein